MRLVVRAAIVLAAAAALSACSETRDLDESSSAASCTECHGFPPERASSSGEVHPSSQTCADCHADTVDANNDVIPGGAHMNQHVDVTITGCTGCHGYPPEQTAGGLSHTSSTNCVVCHTATVDENNDLIPGGAHRNGSVDATGGHEMPFVPQHTAAALADIASCTACHGTSYEGGTGPSCNGCHEASLGFSDWKTNCTFCHGGGEAGRNPSWGGNVAEAAPPQTVLGPDVDPDQTSTNAKVGAHQRHLVAGTYSAPLACESCHSVPTADFPGSLDHVNGTATAAIQFSDTAKKGVTSPAYAGGSCAVYCHGSTSLLTGGTNETPAWTSTGGVVCGSCHDVEKTTDRPDVPNDEHRRHRGKPCSSCHPGYAVGGSPTVNLDTHMNGTFDASPINTATTYSTATPGWPAGCACH